MSRLKCFKIQFEKWCRQLVKRYVDVRLCSSLFFKPFVLPTEVKTGAKVKVERKSSNDSSFNVQNESRDKSFFFIIIWYYTVVTCKAASHCATNAGAHHKLCHINQLKSGEKKFIATFLVFSKYCYFFLSKSSLHCLLINRWSRALRKIPR